MKNKPVTLEGLRKDVLHLYALVIALQDSHNALRNQVQRMEGECDKPTPRVDYLEVLKSEVFGVKAKAPFTLTPSPVSPKPRTNKGRKGSKNK